MKKELTSFNTQSRTVNSLKSSVLGVSNHVFRIILEFAFRTVFLQILSAAYLGLNGLFTNVLSILSLAELGIGTAIIFRLYQPIRDNDPMKVAAIMDFYKKIYRIIALVVAVCGLILMPFIQYLIKSDAEIPKDINIYVIYSLFLIQSVSSYFFVFKQSILNADQRAYGVSIINIVLNLIRYSVQIIVLVVTKNFLWTLVGAISSQIAVNFAVSVLISKRYAFVFRIKQRIDPTTRKAIMKDTRATMIHSMGAKIVFGTDNILISKFVGLVETGIYSNYSLITMAIHTFVTQINAAFTGSLGNLHTEKNIEQERRVYYRITFINLWITFFCSVCLFVLLNPFIEIWQSKTLTFNIITVMVLCISFFITAARQSQSQFINATGLFVKDKLRPLFESAINLTASILLVMYLGLVGIFVGTIISSLLTVFWREPYLLHKFVLKCSMLKYWLMVLFAFLLTVATACGMYFLCELMPLNLGYFILRLFLCLLLPNLIFIAATFWTKEFKYVINLIKHLFSKLFAKIFRKNKSVSENKQQEELNNTPLETQTKSDNETKTND